MTQAQQAPYEFDFTKIFGEFKLPVLNVDGVAGLLKKNLDAFQKANAVAFEAFQQTTKQQAEFLRNAFDALTAAVGEITEAKTTEDRLTKQTALAKENVQKTLANIREISDIVAKANAQSFAVVSARINESFDDFAGLVNKAA